MVYKFQDHSTTIFRYQSLSGDRLAVYCDNGLNNNFKKMLTTFSREQYGIGNT